MLNFVSLKFGERTLSFVRFSSDFLMETFTLVDNLFVHEHLPYLEEKQIKVYIYGLYLCATNGDNTTETLCTVLDVTEDELVAIYKEFEDLGLVKILNTAPFEVRYLSLKRGMQPPKKYKAERWNDFNTTLQSLFPERLLTPNEYNEYYNFIDGTKINEDVLLMIVQYCIDAKGPSVRYPYVFAVARSWLQDGVRTVEDVERKLNEFEAQSDEMRQVLLALGRKSGADIEEKQTLRKWKRSWGYELPAILTAAKLLKGGKTFKRLDAKLDEYFRMNIFSSQEMENYVKYREHLTELAISINKTIGVYYESLEHVIEVYTIPWTTKGFSDEALLKIAHYCFVSGVRTLDGMNTAVGKFYTQGYLTVEGIDEFISAGLKQDGKIKEIIEKMGQTRNVTVKDREVYRTWTVTWGFGDEVILYAAELSTGKAYPIPFMNQLLSSWKNLGISTLEEAKKQPVSSQNGENKKRTETYTERNYTDDELQSIFSDIDKFDNLDI